jgi:hypothetical protein
MASLPRQVHEIKSRSDRRSVHRHLFFDKLIRHLEGERQVFY